MSLQSVDLNVISGEIVDAAMKVHSALGPGLLESTYAACLAHELRLRSLEVRLQVPLPIRYQGVLISVGYRIDMLVQNAVIVELKVVFTRRSYSHTSNSAIANWDS